MGWAPSTRRGSRLLQRYVAIKTLPRDVLEQEDSHALFHREAEIVARLEHPNILPIFDYGEHGSIPYLVMPLIGGGTLLDWDPGPLEQALPVISRVLGALEYAHAQHVVHRDIKPTNILMHHGGWPLIADFGLARIIDPHLYLTRPGYRVGTPGFMARSRSKARMPTTARTSTRWASSCSRC